ncbi:DUF3987 domain-containing protein [Pontibacter burrus]|uniref:DUF3987 domain-containing protein n=1 Tax=Pontibacter burrus TaxID=2704466 RepID=A0A6B3M1J6_9BACT|nr:DUF3987 domain-containing protein [Pontibacter burrus]NEM99461.1 DUF3987 domain-containing protein [Pontibacter burrus]
MESNQIQKESTTSLGSEISKLIKSNVVSHNIAKLVQSAQPVNPSFLYLPTQEGSRSLADTPTIPEEVYNKLPEILRRGSYMFDNSRDKDVFLTGALTILSGCMNSVDGLYDSQEVYANLNCFIIAPPASGKGKLVYAKMLGDSYHEKLLNESERALRQYSASLRESETANQATQGNVQERPPFNILFIPGNSSSSAVIKHLKEGDAKGIFCETEADTLSNSLKQDWGNFSDLFRKAFHHESVSYSRKTNNEFYEIRKPRLSVALSGTPSQVRAFIPSAEDGLFSRFIFYAFNAAPVWRSVAPVEGRQDLTSHFAQLSERVLAMVEYLEDSPSAFHLTNQQWSTLNDTFTMWLKEVHGYFEGDASSIVKRLGLILFRIAMIMTCLRKYEQNSKDLNITCTDEDFNLAFELVKVYKEHALTMYAKLPKAVNIQDKTIADLYNELPARFKREEAIEIGKKAHLSVRVIDKYLSMLMTTNQLTKSKYAQYLKVEKQ